MALRIVSLNMHGFNTSCDYIKKLATNFDIILIQEHMLKDIDTYLLNSCACDFNVFVTGAEQISNVGRPSGGLCILVNKNIAVKADLSVSINKRVNSVLLDIAGTPVLVFNVYLPCHDGTQAYEASLELCCEFINTTIDCYGGGDCVYIVAGDFNCNDMTIVSDRKCAALHNLINNHNLMSLASQYTGSLRYTYCCDSTGNCSWLDNIYASNLAPQTITIGGFDVLDDVDNFSDHFAVCANLISARSVVSSCNCPKLEHYSYIWSKMGKDNYYASTGYKMQNLLNVFGDLMNICDDKDDCNCDGHINILNGFYADIVKIMKECSLPLYVKLRTGVISWSPILTALKKSSKQKTKDWRLAGSPLVGDLWEIKKLAKRAYRNELDRVRKCGLKNKLITMQRFMHTNDSINFWKMWNKQNIHNVKSYVHKADDFVEQFKNNFAIDHDKVNKMKDFMDNTSFHNNQPLKLNVESVEQAVKKLQCSNSLDCDNLNIYHILYSHPAVYVCLSKLFNAMLRHGVVPNGMGISIIHPVIKNKVKSVHDIANYRPISIVPIMAKIFESCIANIIETNLVSHTNQFGFVKNGGCGKALFTFRNIVRYFRNNNSNVFICSLDLTKAFDKINHVALLNLMVNKGINAKIVKTYADWFCKMCAKVNWNNCTSAAFSISSGVAQGSLLGGKFFNLVMDTVLHEMQEKRLGCHIDNVFAGAVAYADDLVLMSPSLVCLQQMVDICAQIFKSAGLSFNVDKCIAVVCGKPLSLPRCVDLYGVKLPWSSELCYLGVNFIIGIELRVDISARVRKFISSVSSVLRGRVSGFEDVYLNVILTKCMPILFYGIDCLCVDSRSMNSLSVIWNTAFRWILGITRYEHMRKHLQKCNTMSFRYLINQRLLVFVSSLSLSSNYLLSKLVCWYRNNEELKCILRDYGLWFVRDINTIKQVVRDAFRRHCEELD